MCGGELSMLVGRIKNSADSLELIHREEQYLCEKELIIMEATVQLLRKYSEREKEPEEEVDGTGHA